MSYLARLTLTAGVTWLFLGGALLFITLSVARPDPPRWTEYAFTGWVVIGMVGCFVLAVYSIWAPSGSLLK